MKTHPDFECFLAYAPRGGGLLCAVVYRARGDDVYGWWVGRDANLEYPPAFFMLENYYTTHSLFQWGLSLKRERISNGV